MCSVLRKRSEETLRGRLAEKGFLEEGAVKRAFFDDGVLVIREGRCAGCVANRRTRVAKEICTCGQVLGYDLAYSAGWLV